jgi:hypothetical protein
LVTDSFAANQINDKCFSFAFEYNKSPYYSAMLHVNFVYVTPLLNKVGRRTTAAIDRD